MNRISLLNQKKQKMTSPFESRRNISRHEMELLKESLLTIRSKKLFRDVMVAQKKRLNEMQYDELRMYAIDIWRKLL